MHLKLEFYWWLAIVIIKATAHCSAICSSCIQFKTSGIFSFPKYTNLLNSLLMRYSHQVEGFELIHFLSRPKEVGSVQVKGAHGWVGSLVFCMLRGNSAQLEILIILLWTDTRRWIFANKIGFKNILTSAKGKAIQVFLIFLAFFSSFEEVTNDVYWWAEI